MRAMERSQSRHPGQGGGAGESVAGRGKYVSFKRAVSLFCSPSDSA